MSLRKGLLCDKVGEFVDKSRDMFIFTFYISCNLKRNELLVQAVADLRLNVFPSVRVYAPTLLFPLYTCTI